MAAGARAPRPEKRKIWDRRRDHKEPYDVPTVFGGDSIRHFKVTPKEYTRLLRTEHRIVAAKNIERIMRAEKIPREEAEKRIGKMNKEIRQQVFERVPLLKKGKVYYEILDRRENTPKGRRRND